MSACTDPPEESCSDAGCPAHGWTQCPLPDCINGPGEHDRRDYCQDVAEAVSELWDA